MTDGTWPRLKQEAVEKYTQTYGVILSPSKRARLHHVFVDAFAGPAAGDPLAALHVRPPFQEYHLIDLGRDRAAQLREVTAAYPNVQVHEAGCSDVLLGRVWPHIQADPNRRGLVMIAPSGLDLRWQVLRAAGRLRTVDIFLHLPMAQADGHPLWADGGDPRLDDCWGDGSWRAAAAGGCAALAEAFRRRLEREAGFSAVPEPLAVPGHYLYFASNKSVALGMVRDLFNRYRR